jgi:hypothetical protein
MPQSGVFLLSFYIRVSNFVAQLIAPGQGSLVYKYKTEVKLSVANGQYDLQNQITADVHIKSLGDCNYALQVNI